MKNLAQIFIAIVLVAGLIYLIATPKDDDAMAAFKQQAASFIRSDKPSASLREVLGRGGDQICVKYKSRNMEITVQDYKVLTIMKGRNDITVDGKTYILDVLSFKWPTGERSACYEYAKAKLVRSSDRIYFDGAKSNEVKKSVQEKPKPKKKSAPPPVKKTTKPARSYGY